MFKKKKILTKKAIVQDPSSMQNLTTAEGYLKRGMAFYARQQYENAENDLRTALSMNDGLIDVYYSLGMVLKAASKREEAVLAFEKVLTMLNQGRVKNSDQLAMLRRLAKGHINMIKTGDWNLEKEIWQHVE